MSWEVQRKSLRIGWGFPSNHSLILLVFPKRTKTMCVISKICSAASDMSLGSRRSSVVQAGRAIDSFCPAFLSTVSMTLGSSGPNYGAVMTGCIGRSCSRNTSSIKHRLCRERRQQERLFEISEAALLKWRMVKDVFW